MSGGHHDAGDYSKYTINSAGLVHTLVFAADAIPGVAALDNLGLPESGDGVSDVLEEAKWEADFLSKMQDDDGGLLLSGLPPRPGIRVGCPARPRRSAGGLAEEHLSDRRRGRRPRAMRLVAEIPPGVSPRPRPCICGKARLGWKFLQAAIARHGRKGAYQKITFYGDDWGHDDEMAWAACELYLATGEPAYRTELFAWLPDPADPATFKWGWQHLSQSWGNAIREYAFAARTGRLPADRLDPRYLTACENQVLAAGNDALAWSRENAYATSFPLDTKRYSGGGWYFSLSQAMDLAAAAAIDPDPEYDDAILGNFNYEAGCNPVDVCYVAGLGWKRPRLMVDQYAANAGRAAAADRHRRGEHPGRVLLAVPLSVPPGPNQLPERLRIAAAATQSMTAGATPPTSPPSSSRSISPAGSWPQATSPPGRARSTEPWTPRRGADSPRPPGPPCA